MGLGADWAERGPPAGWPLRAASSLPGSPLHHAQQEGARTPGTQDEGQKAPFSVRALKQLQAKAAHPV